MNLERFKPTWSQVKVMNQFGRLTEAELLRIIRSEVMEVTPSVWKKVMWHAALYSLLIILCQG